MKRRTFIKAGGAGMLAGMLMPKTTLANLIPSNKIGLQLYTLRDAMKENPRACLEQIAKIGYTELEAAGYGEQKFYGYEPEEFKSMIEDLGMRLVSSHLTFDNENVGRVLEAHHKAGIQYMVWPWLNQEQRSSIDSYMEFIEKCNIVGKMCKDNGMRFGYHNHDFEFYEINGKVPYDLFLTETDPELVCMQLDLYWIIYAGKDPKAYFEKYPGRFELWHVKDMAGDGSKDMTEVGQGIIDYAELFEYAQKAGMKEFFVEQDSIKGDAFESVKLSFEHVNSIVNA